MSNKDILGLLESFKDALDDFMKYAGHHVVYRYKTADGKVVDKLVQAAYFQRSKSSNSITVTTAGVNTDVLEAYVIKATDIDRPVKGDLIVEFFAKDGKLQLDKVMSVYEIADWAMEKVGDNSLIYIAYVQRREFSKWAYSRTKR
jgi:hypothetical protein